MDDLVVALPDGRLFVSDEAAVNAEAVDVMRDIAARSNSWTRSEHAFGWVFSQQEED
jgi:hypothetical protein